MKVEELRGASGIDEDGNEGVMTKLDGVFNLRKVIKKP